MKSTTTVGLVDAGAQVGGIHAVDDEAVLGAAGAIDLDAARLALGRRARRRLDQVGEVAAARDAVDQFGVTLPIAAFCLTSMIGDSATTCTFSLTPASDSASSTRRI